MGQQKRVGGQQQLSANPAVNTFLIKKRRDCPNQNKHICIHHSKFHPRYKHAKLSRIMSEKYVHLRCLGSVPVHYYVALP